MNKALSSYRQRALKRYNYYSYFAPVATKRLAVLFPVICILTLVVLLSLRPGSAYTDVRAWRDVSLFQIIKMHLAPRPRQTNLPAVCPSPMPRPGVTLSQMNTSKIFFYEDVKEKMKNLPPEDRWKQQYAPLLSRQEKLELVHLYAVFQHAMDSAGLRHQMIDGSALGVWRSHGLTPWDDDMDIAVDPAQSVEIKQALSCIEGFSLITPSLTKWYFYRNNGSVIPNEKNAKRWPFLDLFFYTSDSNYVFALDYVLIRKGTYKREYIYPLQLRPFEGLMVPVAGQLRTTLEYKYSNPTMCVSPFRNHRISQEMEKITVPCDKLSDMYTMHITDN